MIFLVAFAVKNNTPVRLYYYFNFQSPEIPLFVIVLVSVFIGALCVWLMALFDKLRMKMIISKKEKTIKEMEKELPRSLFRKNRRPWKARRIVPKRKNHKLLLENRCLFSPIITIF